MLPNNPLSKLQAKAALAEKAAAAKGFKMPKAAVLKNPPSSNPPSSNPPSFPLSKARPLVSTNPNVSKYIAGIVGDVKKKLINRKGMPSTVTLLSSGEILSEVTEWIPTGFEGIDAATGGGLPIGRASEVFGPEAAGKSAFMRACVRGVQSMGGVAILLDYEVAMDPSKFHTEGIDPTRVVYSTPPTIEEGLNILRDHFDAFEKKRPKFPIFIGWDSIAFAIARAEQEEESANDAHVAVQARAMGKVFRACVRRVADLRIHLMFVNQERTKIGGYSRGGYVPMDTPGGRAAKFYSTVRIRCTRKQTLGNAVKTGYLLDAQVIKNKIYPPHRRAEWIIDFEYGPSPELTTFHTLLKNNEIKTQGGGYVSPKFLPGKPPLDRHGWVKVMRENPALYDLARARSAEIVRATGIAPPPLGVDAGDDPKEVADLEEDA